MSVPDCLLFITLMMSAAPVVRDPSLLRVVAEVGDRQIRYGDIACDRTSVPRDDRLLHGRSVDEVCLEVEQARFKGAVAAQIKEQACAIEHCPLADSDIAAFLDPRVNDAAHARRFASNFKRNAEAAARVLRGETAEAVYAEVGEQLGVSLEQFRLNVTRYREMWTNPLEVIEGWLVKDWESAFHESQIKVARGRAMNAFLRARLAALATANQQSIDAAANAYLATLLETIDIKILDDRFKLPTAKEVFR